MHEVRADRFTGVQVDSRRIVPGDLFVAVGKGTDFLDDAVANGAVATLVPDDAFAALARLGSAVRERSSARVVAITGSMGKTSTKDILAALCMPTARTIAAEASYNNEIGVPLTLCRLEEDTEVCILELAMRGFGQIAELAAIARPADRGGDERRAGASRARRLTRRRCPGEGRVDRSASAGWDGDRPERFPGRARRHRRRENRRACRGARRRSHGRRRCQLQLHRSAPGAERSDGAGCSRRAWACRGRKPSRSTSHAGVGKRKSSRAVAF